MLADFGHSAALGFQTGQQMGEGSNPLGNFIRMMLSDWQNRRQVEGEYAMKKGLIEEEAKAKAQNPTILDKFLLNQLSGNEASILPQSPSEAKAQFIGGNKDVSSDELTTDPVYSTIKGQKILSGYLAKMTPVAEEFRKKGTTITKDRQDKAEALRYSTQDSLDTIKEVEKGIGYFGAGGIIPAIPGLQANKANWEANINKLLSGKIIDTMTKLKEASKTGATGFGQLSNKELEVLRQSSTALKKSLSPKDAQRYLDKMKTLLLKVNQANSSNGGGILMEDANGNRAMVFPDGTFKETE